MNFEDIYAKGYAVPSYDIEKGLQHWRYRDEVITLPYGSVALWHVGDNIEVANIEEVRRVAKENQARAARAA